jgi:hypothetical protein
VHYNTNIILDEVILVAKRDLAAKRDLWEKGI